MIEKSINYDDNEKANIGKCSFTYKMLHERIKSLYLHKPYYGYTLSRMSRTLSISTQTACVLPSQMTLMVNPFFFEKMEIPQQLAVLEHEILHIGFFHHDRYQIIEKESDAFKSETFNIAADCAINQLIENMPEGSITLSYVQSFAEDVVLKEKQSAEYYYKVLVASSSWKNSYDNDKALQKKIAEIKQPFVETYKDVTSLSKSMFKKIMREAKKKQKKHEKKVGTQGGFSLCDVLPSYDGPVHKDIWKQLIDKSFGEEPIAAKNYCYGRPSRRNSDSLYYTKHLVESRSVYLGIDTSGSVTQKQLDTFVGYIQKGMRSNDCTVICIQADTRIVAVDKIKRANQLNNLKVYGRGGTDMRCILDYIEKHEKNPRNARLILLTDGYTPFRESSVKVSVVYTKDHSKIERGVWNSAVLEVNEQEEY